MSTDQNRLVPTNGGIPDWKNFFRTNTEMHHVYYSYVIGMKEEGILRNNYVTALLLAYWSFITAVS